MPEMVLELWRQAASNQPELRVSQEVTSWLECRRREAESVALRRAYEHNVQSGVWPAQETVLPLFPYQREGMLHLACAERALLADELGLGKTVQAIAASALLRRLGRAERVLIVTAASLKGEWEEQIERFTRFAYQSPGSGTRHERLAAYDRAGAPFFTIVNYEQMLTDSLEVNERLKPEVVILDESQRIKNWNTKTAMAVKRLQEPLRLGADRHAARKPHRRALFAGQLSGPNRVRAARSASTGSSTSSTSGVVRAVTRTSTSCANASARCCCGGARRT